MRYANFANIFCVFNKKNLKNGDAAELLNGELINGDAAGLLNGELINGDAAELLNGGVINGEMVMQRSCLMVKKMDTRLRDSGEIGFCKRLKYKWIDGVLLLQGTKLRDGEIAKEVAGALIFVVGIGDQ